MRRLRPPQDDTARALAERGIEVWLIDLHATCFVPSGRDSIGAFDPANLAELIERARQNRASNILLSFWTSGVPPCVEELPSLQRLERRFRARPFEIVSINVGEELSQSVDSWRGTGSSCPCCMTPRGRPYATGRSTLIPRSI